VGLADLTLFVDRKIFSITTCFMIGSTKSTALLKYSVYLMGVQIKINAQNLKNCNKL